MKRRSVVVVDGTVPAGRSPGLTESEIAACVGCLGWHTRTTQTGAPVCLYRPFGGGAAQRLSAFARRCVGRSCGSWMLRTDGMRAGTFLIPGLLRMSERVIPLSHGFGRRRSSVLEKTWMNRLLAVDYGRKRIGLAVSDPLRIIATPVGVIAAGRESVQRVADVVRTYEVTEVILGIPPEDAGDGLREEIERFGRELEVRTGIAVKLVDETMTTREAVDRVHANGGRLHRVKHRLDALAASVLLQDVLDGRRVR